MKGNRQIIYISSLLQGIIAIERQLGRNDVRGFLTHELSKIGVLKNVVEELLNLLDAGSMSLAEKLVVGSASHLPKPIAIKSIFSSISLEPSESRSVDSRSKEYGYMPLEINLNNYQFPTPASKVLDRNIQLLLEGFWKEHEYLGAASSLDSYAYALLGLLYKFGSRLSAPFSYPSQDVSVYDHTRLVAAASNCLSISEDSSKASSFIFLIGDLSGLQKFIYSEIDMSEAGDGKGLAQRLRGRSYYIVLLTEVIAERLAEAFDVNEVNILYAGGGGFQLLLPKTENYKERIANFTKEINQFLFEKIGGRIGLITGYVEADQTIFQGSSQFIQRAYDHIGEEKARKYESNLDYLFFERPKQRERKFEDDEKLGEKIPYGKLVLEVEATGLQIKQDRLLEPQASLEALGRYFFILDERKRRSDIEADAKIIIEAYQDQALSFRLLSINDTEFLSLPISLMQQLPELDIRAGFRFIGSYAPTQTHKGSDSVIMFEQLAKKNDVDEDGELSYPKLAVMRLDVDNLGALFALGLGEQASFARVATLSRELHLFFSGYFNKLAEKYSLYVTYSGGDDAFVVGSWLNVMHAADELRDEFKRLVCNRPELSFSAGVFMCSEYYPVAKFAQKANDAEEKAKNFKFQDHEKDAICVFDHALSWNQYKEMLQLAQTILTYVEQANETDRNKISRSLIHRIHLIVKRCIKDGSINTRSLYQQTARLHYLFARQTTVKDGFNHQFLEKTAAKAQAGESLNLGEQIAQHVIRVFLDYFKTGGGDKDGKNAILGNLTVATSYVTYKTRTTEK
jgi:CRISPR-associated protein Csm1